LKVQQGGGPWGGKHKNGDKRGKISTVSEGGNKRGKYMPPMGGY